MNQIAGGVSGAAAGGRGMWCWRIFPEKSRIMKVMFV